MELKLDFSPFPTLETDRLILREIKHTDVKEVFFFRSDKEIMQYIPRPLAESEKDALDHIDMIQNSIAKEDGINWGITLKGDDKIIGIAGLYRINKPSFRAEIGYLLNPKHHGKGIISETIQKIMEYGFDSCDFHTITAIIDPANHASEKVLQRANFEKEAHFKEDFYFNGEFLDSIHYSMKNPKH